MFYVYFLRSLKNSKVYVGMTEKESYERLIEHNHGKNKWARENKPFILVYYESYVCKPDVLKREKFYKTGIGRQIRDAVIDLMPVDGLY